jgi:hypothetical protein
MRPPSVFISSTYRDLRFERLFVRKFLVRRGFDVITMEDQCRPEFDWERWSKNRSGQCDVLVQLLADRIGTSATPFIGLASITKIERDHARACGVDVIACYELHRPFPDAQRLYTLQEEQEYKRTLEEIDIIWANATAMMIERQLRIATPIESVKELETHLAIDTSLSLWRLTRDRWRRWSKAYWNTTSAAWLRVFEDESHVASTNRILSRRFVRRIKWIGGLAIGGLAILLLLRLVPVVWTGIALIAAVLICFILFIAWAPTYCWVGTKTVIARGLFGMRTLQQLRTEPLKVTTSWDFIQEFTAVRIRFSSGQRIFVPFVRDDFVVPMFEPTPPAQAIKAQDRVSPDLDVAVAVREFAKRVMDEEQSHPASKVDPDSTHINPD